MRRLFTFGIIGLIGIAGGMVASSIVQQQAPAQQNNGIIDSATVQRGDIELVVRAEGVIEPARRAQLEFGTTYVVSEVLVDEADSVQAGDVIARLDMTDYELSVASAENQLAASENQFDNIVQPPREVELNAARAALDAAEASAYAAYLTAPSDEEIEIARLEVENSRNQLWQGQLNRDVTLSIGQEFRARGLNDPASQVEQLNGNLDFLETGIGIAEQNLSEVQTLGPNGNELGSALEAIVSAEISIDNLLNPDERDVELSALSMYQAALNVEYTTAQIVDLQLVAPFSGIVIENNLTVGELPPRGAAIVLADTGTLTVEVDVEESAIVGVQAGLPVSVRVDALPEASITGRITQVSVLPEADENIPTYVVTVTLDPVLEPVRPGMSATAEIELSNLSNVVTVPTRFIQTEVGETFVTVQDGSAVRRVSVRTGRQDGMNTQILSGLEPGQQVALVEETARGLRSLVP